MKRAGIVRHRADAGPLARKFAAMFCSGERPQEQAPKRGSGYGLFYVASPTAGPLTSTESLLRSDQIESPIRAV